MTSTMVPDPVAAAVRAVVDRVGPGLYGLACSGGADSIALAHAAIHVVGAPHVVVLSIDHGLTPGSATVAQEVAAWASAQGAAGVVRRVNVERRPSIEAAARDARYAALEALADELGLVVVLLGHTARDQAETVMMRILRGTGPAGLVGIPAQRGRFVRPMLGLLRERIDAYVAAHALRTWDDPMNDDPRLARVRMRRDLLPVLRRENPQLDAALVRLAGSAGEWLVVIDALAAPLGQLPIDCRALAQHPAAVRKRALSLALDAAAIDYDAVHLERLDRVVVAHWQGEVVIELPGGALVRSYDQLDRREAHSPMVDPLRIPVGPYALRVWRPGDRMRPVRLKGRSRKLSDLFADARVPRSRRAGARVLVRTTDDEIVWVEYLGLAFGEPAERAPLPTQMAGSF